MGDFQDPVATTGHGERKVESKKTTPPKPKAERTNNQDPISFVLEEGMRESSRAVEASRKGLIDQVDNGLGKGEALSPKRREELASAVHSLIFLGAGVSALQTSLSPVSAKSQAACDGDNKHSVACHEQSRDAALRKVHVLLTAGPYGASSVRYEAAVREEWKKAKALLTSSSSQPASDSRTK